MNSMKADLIRKYVAGVDFRSDDWSIHMMAEEMKRFLGEMPSIDVNYKKDVMVTELTGVSKEITKLDKVSVIFTDTDDRIKKLEFKV